MGSQILLYGAQPCKEIYVGDEELTTNYIKSILIMSETGT